MDCTFFYELVGPKPRLMRYRHNECCLHLGILPKEISGNLLAVEVVHYIRHSQTLSLLKLEQRPRLWEVMVPPSLRVQTFWTN